MSARAKSPTPRDRRELASERSEVRMTERPPEGAGRSSDAADH
jgi:hypothetical protein